MRIAASGSVSLLARREFACLPVGRECGIEDLESPIPNPQPLVPDSHLSTLNARSSIPSPQFPAPHPR